MGRSSHSSVSIGTKMTSQTVLQSKVLGVVAHIMTNAIAPNPPPPPPPPATKHTNTGIQKCCTKTFF